MATSWSNPNAGQGVTASQLGNSAHISQADIGPIVATILQARARKQAQDQQNMNNIISGVAKGVAAYQNNQREGAANDAANAAIYGIQNPNDPWGGYNNPDVVPDYGGSDALKALESARMMQPDLYESADEKALRAAQTAAANAHADYYLRGANASGMQSPIEDPNTGMIWNGHQWVLPHGQNNAWGDMIPLARGKLDNTGNFTNQYSGAENGDYIKLQPSKGGEPIIVPYEAWKQRSSNARALPQPNAAGSAGVNPNDVAQAARAMAGEQPDIPYGKEIPDTTMNPPDTSSTPRTAPRKNAQAATDRPPAEPTPGTQPEKSITQKASELYGKGKLAPTPTPAGTPSAQPTPQAPQVKSVEDYNKIPSGQPYIDPNGVRRIKS